MARYKHTEAEKGQGLFLSVNLKEQLIPGTFEYMLDNLIGNKIDIKYFDKNYKNDKTGAKAIPPKVLIKLIIYGYSKGVKSSRGIEELCKNNIIAKALSEDMEPHWTTIANFISSNENGFKDIFIKVLTYCTELGLVGGKIFAIDGCRLPSNAAIDLTGTAEELGKRLNVYRRMAEKHIAKHKRKDSNGEIDEKSQRNYDKQQKKLNRQIERITEFLGTMEYKGSRRGKEMRSNVTDNESALIWSSSGYIQGYIGLAVSDKENQVIVEAKAVGSANECEHLPEILDTTLSNMNTAGIQKPENGKLKLLADSNYFSEVNLCACQARGVEGIMPDSQYKRRLTVNNEKRFEASDFIFHESVNYYECPNGKNLGFKGKSIMPGGVEGSVYQASIKDCRICPLIKKCLRTKKEISKIDKGRKLLISRSNETGSLCNMLRENMNNEEYQDQYAYRIQIIEPVFANITYSKRLNRFSLRGKSKVNGQWQLYCIMHNLGKCLNGYNKGKEIA